MDTLDYEDKLELIELCSKILRFAIDGVVWWMRYSSEKWWNFEVKSKHEEFLKTLMEMGELLGVQYDTIQHENLVYFYGDYCKKELEIMAFLLMAADRFN